MPMAPGLTIGYHRSLPGGWGERLVAPERHLHPLPGQLSDRTAVLIEPLSIGVHAVLNCPPREGEPALVIGSGPIALAPVWALRALGFRGEVVAQPKRPHEAELARALGASLVVAPGDEARTALVQTHAGKSESTPIPTGLRQGGRFSTSGAKVQTARLNRAVRERPGSGG